MTNGFQAVKSRANLCDICKSRISLKTHYMVRLSTCNGQSDNVELGHVCRSCYLESNKIIRS